MRPPLVPGRGSRSITFFFFFFSLEALPRRARLGAGAMQAVGVLSDPAEELGGGIPSYGKARGGGLFAKQPKPLFPGSLPPFALGQEVPGVQ